MTAPNTRLWFIRHGEVEEGRVGAFLGRTDVGLSPMGKHQAEALRAYLEDAPIDAIVSSPLKRARETVRPLASAKGRIVDIRSAFAEMDFGEWDGLHWNEILERDAHHAQAWQADIMGMAALGGETGTQFSQRVGDGLAQLLEEFRGRTVLVAAHAGTNRAILAYSLGITFRDAFAFAQDYGCVNAAAWVDGYAQIALTNFVPGPKSVTQGDGAKGKRAA